MQQETQDAFKLLDSAETCAVLRIGKSKLHQLVKEGKLRRSSVSVGRALFTEEEIRRLIATPLGPQESFQPRQDDKANGENQCLA